MERLSITLPVCALKADIIMIKTSVNDVFFIVKILFGNNVFNDWKDIIKFRKYKNNLEYLIVIEHNDYMLLIIKILWCLKINYLPQP